MQKDELLFKKYLKKIITLADIKTAVVAEDLRLLPLKSVEKFLFLPVKAEISSMPGTYDIKYFFLS